MDEEIVCYQIEILVPTGTHKYIYSDKIPTNEEVQTEYGLFTRVGSVNELMHVVQHRQQLESYKTLLNFYRESYKEDRGIK